MATIPGPTPSPASAPAPAPKSNALWWILGVLGALVALCVVGGLFVAGLVVQNVRVHKAGDRVEVSTPVGDLSVRQTPAASAGLPVYPGARRNESGKNVEMTLPDDQSLGVTVVSYRTSDALDKVDAWYRAHLGPEFKRDDQSGGHGKIRVQGVETEGVAYVAEKGDFVRFVAIAKKDDGVEIKLGRVGTQEPQ